MWPPVEDYRRSRVQRFRGSRLHYSSRISFGMRVYEKSVSFVRSYAKFGAKMAITLEMSIFNEDFRSLMPSLPLTLNL